jgi:hypothetical protein
MKIRKNGKVVRLTESDLRRITKRVISEENLGDRYNVEDFQIPITHELINSKVRDFLNEYPVYLEDMFSGGVPQNKVDMVINDLSVGILEYLHVTLAKRMGNLLEDMDYDYMYDE